MNLLFDLTASQPSNTIKRHGGGKYCEMLFDGLCKRKTSFQAFYDSSKYLSSQVLECSKQHDIKLHDINDKPLQLIVNQNGIDIIYSALPEALLPWPDCRILGTIHGLRSLELGRDFWGHWLLDTGFIGLNSLLGFLFYKRNKKQTFKYYQKLLQTSNFSFVTVSNHSKNVIQTICPDLDVPVFYPPPTTASQSKKTSNEKYILMVSADRFEKNCTRAIIAIDKLLSKKRIPSDTAVKITGPTNNISRYNLKNISNFKFLGYVDEDELDSLYANAHAFIYPSLNEGFGYPPLEAMKYNVPVIASNVASIPEVCGNAALYFNPTSISELEDRIVELQNRCIYSDLQKKGAIRFQEIETKQKKDLDKLIDWIIHNST